MKQSDYGKRSQKRLEKHYDISLDMLLHHFSNTTYEDYIVDYHDIFKSNHKTFKDGIILSIFWLL